MATFSALETAKRGLMTQKFGIDVTSNNINNINTPGYSRRSAVITETTPTQTSNGFVGTGAIGDSLRTYREEFFDKEIRKSLARQSGYETDQVIFERVEAILAEPSSSGIGEVVQGFLATFEDVANNPQDPSIRDYVLEQGKSLVDRLHTTSDMLDASRNDVLRDLKSDTDSVNQLLQNVAELNKQSASSKASVSVEAQTFVDQRENALEALAKLTGANVTHEDNGQVNVFINGSNVVTGSVYAKLELQETVNSATGERTAIIAKSDSSGKSLGVITPPSGEMSVRLKAYNTLLDPNDSSQDYSAYSKINEYVDILAKKINSISVGGYGSNDTGNTPAGRPFFESPTGNFTANNIQINSEILNDSANIPLADAPGESGNNEIALKIARIANDKDFAKGITHTEFYSAILGRVGSLSSESLTGKKTMDLVVQQLESQRESLIGVDNDEEAVNLIKFQKAFEASSRVVNTSNEILATLINLGR